MLAVQTIVTLVAAPRVGSATGPHVVALAARKCGRSAIAKDVLHSQAVVQRAPRCDRRLQKDVSPGEALVLHGHRHAVNLTEGVPDAARRRACVANGSRIWLR